jgi:hypothetical protein
MSLSTPHPNLKVLYKEQGFPMQRVKAYFSFYFAILKIVWSNFVHFWLCNNDMNRVEMGIGGIGNYWNNGEMTTCTLCLIMSWCLSLLMHHLLSICRVLLLTFWYSSSRRLMWHTSLTSRGSNNEVISHLATMRMVHGMIIRKGGWKSMFIVARW